MRNLWDWLLPLLCTLPAVAFAGWLNAERCRKKNKPRMIAEGRAKLRAAWANERAHIDYEERLGEYQAHYRIRAGEVDELMKH